ncbi:unannotated protein [freshwater metagenome]|jgi:hypothetical protein|uniref:Unannotated protein n=1 Tax=freshwater metagenome TaxID=449393 RepID=A0A6J7DCP9_9ZZZZ
MYAVELPNWGDADLLELKERELPSFGPREVLVKIEAAGVNPVDYKVRGGNYSAAFNEGFPMVLGRDFSGQVLAVGADVTAFKVGDAVLGTLRMAPRLGCYATHIVVSDSAMALRPVSVDAVRAAALPVAGLTAWQALVEMAGVSAGQTVLVQAAAGGVGHLVVQLAKFLGAHVIATASPRNHDFLRELGADEVIDYTSVAFEDVVSDVDAVIDCVGGDVLDRSLHVLKAGGIAVTMAARPDPELAEKLGVRVVLIFVRPDAMQLQGLVDLVADGRLRVDIEKTFPLAQATQAHLLQETGHVRGKIVLIT